MIFVKRYRILLHRIFQLRLDVCAESARLAAAPAASWAGSQASGHAGGCGDHTLVERFDAVKSDFG